MIGAARIDAALLLDKPVGISIADCTTDLQAVAADCAATVGDLEACFEDLSSASDAELCLDAPLPAACAPVFPCLGG